MYDPLFAVAVPVVIATLRAAYPACDTNFCDLHARAQHSFSLDVDSFDAPRTGR